MTPDARWSTETENGLTQMLAEEFVVSTTGSRDPNRLAARAVLDWMAHRGLLVEVAGAEGDALCEIFDAVHRMMVTNSRDWAMDRGDAFLWAVFVGWDPEPGDEPDGAMDEVATRHAWGPEQVARLRRFRAAIDAYHAQIAEPQP